MENRSYALAAGLFTVLLSAALVAAVFWIRREPIGHDTYVLHTRGSVSGLNAQAPVRLRGVDVGKVESIEFDPDDRREIQVGIAVRSGTPLTTATYAQLAAQGITGLSYVLLNDDGSSNRLLDPSDPAQRRIELRPSFLERVSGSGEALIGSAVGIAERLDTWLSEANRQQLFRTIASLEAAAQAVAQLSESARTAAAAVPPVAHQAGATLRNADELIAELRTLGNALGERVQTLDRVAASAERIGAAVEDLGSGAKTVAAGVSRETVPKLNATLDEIRRTTRSLERLVDELSANPASLVFGRVSPRPGPGEPGFVHGASQ